MAVLAVASPTLAGATFTAVAAAGGGDSFPNDGLTFFYVKNASGASITVTFDALGPTGTTGPEANVAYNADTAVVVPAAGERLIGPFKDFSRWNDPNGRVVVTYSGVTTLTVLPIKVV